MIADINAIGDALQAANWWRRDEGALCAIIVSLDPATGQVNVVNGMPVSGVFYNGTGVTAEAALRAAIKALAVSLK